MTQPSLEIAGLSITFHGLARDSGVVRDVSLQLEGGGILGLVGESGSGKTLTALACLGMVPQPLTVTGSIKVGGIEVVGRSSDQLRSVRGGKIAMIFQNPMRALNPFFTIGQQMTEYIGHHRSCGPREAQALAIEELRRTQLPHAEGVLGRYPHQLSGGQIQRVMIALALACRPTVLIADEPTTSLDVTVQAQIVSLLRNLADSTGIAILFITHDLGIVSQLCDRVVVMYAGQVVESGSTEDVIDNPQHPYSARLVRTIPQIGKGHRELDSIPGQVPAATSLPSGCVFQDRCDAATDICRQISPGIAPVSRWHKVACHHPGVHGTAAKEAS